MEDDKKNDSDGDKLEIEEHKAHVPVHISSAEASIDQQAIESIRPTTPPAKTDAFIVQKIIAPDEANFALEDDFVNESDNESSNAEWTSISRN